MKKFWVVLPIIALLSACTTSFRAADFTVASTKNYNLNSNKFVIGERVKGIDKSTSIAYMKNAIDNAIQKDRCAVGLSDVVLTVQQGFFSVSYIAEGNLIIDRGLPNCSKAK